MTANNIRDIAAILFDEGWRAADRDAIIKEIGLPEEFADAVCDRLAGIEGTGAEE